MRLTKPLHQHHLGLGCWPLLAHCLAHLHFEPAAQVSVSCCLALQQYVPAAKYVMQPHACEWLWWLSAAHCCRYVPTCHGDFLITFFCVDLLSSGYACDAAIIQQRGIKKSHTSLLHKSTLNRQGNTKRLVRLAACCSTSILQSEALPSPLTPCCCMHVPVAADSCKGPPL